MDSKNVPFLEAQNLFAFHVQKSGIFTSVPVKNNEGKFHIMVTKNVPGLGGKIVNGAFIIRLCTWVEGNDMSNFEPTKKLIQSSGILLAKMHLNIDDFSNSYCFTTHAWDLTNLLLLRKIIHVIEDPSDRNLVGKILDNFETIVLPRYKDCNQAVVQNDFNDANLIVNKRGNEVVGLIDFGDVCMTYLINDLAIAIAYAMLYRSVDVLESGLTFYKTYALHRTLSEIEKTIIWILVAGRLCQSVTWGAYSYSKQPGNNYLLKHAQPAWNALRTLDQSKLQNLDISLLKVTDQSGRLEKKKI